MHAFLVTAIIEEGGVGERNVHQTLLMWRKRFFCIHRTLVFESVGIVTLTTSRLHCSTKSCMSPIRILRGFPLSPSRGPLRSQSLIQKINPCKNLLIHGEILRRNPLPERSSDQSRGRLCDRASDRATKRKIDQLERAVERLRDRSSDRWSDRSSEQANNCARGQSFE